MEILRRTVVFDAADIGAEAHFWAAVLNGQASGDYQWQTVRTADGATPVGIQLAADHRSSHRRPNDPVRVHLDLWVADISSAHREVVSLGAEMVHLASSNENWNVYLSPAGHPFCLVWDPKQ